MPILSWKINAHPITLRTLLSSTVLVCIGWVSILGNVAICSAEEAEHNEAKPWSQFLGPDRNGISAERGLIDSLEKQPVEVWRQPMVGGLSGIAISNDRLLTMSQSDGKQWLMALDAPSGKQLWKTPLANAYQNPMGNGPRATPTIAGEMAYAYTGEGILTAVNVSDGKVAWSKNLPQELKSKPSEYGMSCSPLVVDSLVIVHVGGNGSAVVALDRTTGKIVWKGAESDAGYSSPVLMNLHSMPQVVSLLGNQITGFEPTTGKVLWSYPFVTEFSCNTACPIQIGNRVLLTAGENHGSVLLELEPAKGAWQVNEVWKSLATNSSLRSEWQTPILLDGCLYGFDNVGSAGPVTHLTCVDAATGATLWKKLRFGKGNLIAADGKLFLSTIEGELVLVKASKDSYQELGRKSLVGFTRQAPVISNGKLYLRDESEIVCIDSSKK